MKPTLIETTQITKIYDPNIFFKRGTNYHVLNKIDFTLKKGDFISIMGASGSGKSTLLNCLSGLDMPTTGKVSILGKNTADLKDDELSYLRSHDIGFVFQNHNLIENLTIYDNIATPLILNDTSSDIIDQKVHHYAKRLGIEHLLNKKPLECSGGERQRAAISRAIINNPQILICDEPTGNLDSKNTHEVLKIFCELNKEGTSIILVTHDSVIASYAHIFMYLKDGQIITQLIKNQTNQKDFYEQINKVTEKDILLSVFSHDLDNTKQNITTNQTISSSDIQTVQIDNNKNKSRENVYAVFKNQKLSVEAQKCRLLFVEKQYLQYESITHQNVKINYCDTQKIKLSLSATYRLLGFFSEYMYYVNLDITTKNNHYKLKLENIDDLSPLFQVFIKNHIQIIDPANIIKIYDEHKYNLDRHRYIQRHYKQLQKAQIQ